MATLPVKFFTSSMAGAPVLNGVAGSLVALLDACLITGFDNKAATTLVVAGGVATLTFAGTHSATVESVILVSGVTGVLVSLNGEQKVAVAETGKIKFATAAADGTASGTITFKMAPVGWLKPFTGTNLGAYQSADVQSTKMFFRIDDTGTIDARMRGYETMSDVNTGTGLFPLDTQISGGGYLNKSNQSSTTPVKWRLVADSRGLFLSIVGYSASASATESGRTVFIGDFLPTRPGGDPYAFLLGSGYVGGYDDTAGTCDQTNSMSQFAPRAYHGLGSCTKHASIPETGSAVVSGTDIFFGPFPSKIDGGMRLSRRFIAESTSPEPRGIFPGLLTVPQSNVGSSFAPISVIPGTGVLAGRKLLALGCGANGVSYPSSSLGISFIDITGPWR